MLYATFALTGLLAAAGSTMAHPGEHAQHQHRRGQDYASDPAVPPFNPSEAPNYASQTNVDYYLTATTPVEPITDIPTTTETAKPEESSTTDDMWGWASSSNARSHLFGHSNSTTTAATSTPVPSSQTTAASETTNPPASSTTESVLEVSGTGVAVANRAEYMVAVGGVLIAGLAIV